MREQTRSNTIHTPRVFTGALLVPPLPIETEAETVAVNNAALPAGYWSPFESGNRVGMVTELSESFKLWREINIISLLEQY